MWVAYAAFGTSLLALLVAGVSARISYLSYRASGPLLQLTVLHVETDSATRRVVMSFAVTNRGRGEVDIQGFAVKPYGNLRSVFAVTDILEGPDFPARLPANSSREWKVNVLPVAREYDAALRAKKIKPFSSWPSQVHFVVEAGNGKRAVDRRHTYDTRQLIADAFPSD